MVCALRIVKSMLLTPMPRPRTATAASAKPGSRHSSRIASRTILQERVEERQPALVPVLLLESARRRRRPAAPPRRASSALKPVRHVLGGEQVEVGLNLFRQPLVPPPAQDEVEGSREEYPDAGHDSPSRRRLTMETVRAQSSVSDVSWRRPARGDRVEAGAAVVLARAPGALDPAFLLEAEQRRIDGALIEASAPAAACSMRRAMPKPCSGPMLASVLRTIRSSVPYGTCGVGRAHARLLLKGNMSMPRVMLKGNMGARSSRIRNGTRISRITELNERKLADQVWLATTQTISRGRHAWPAWIPSRELTDLEIRVP